MPGIVERHLGEKDVYTYKELCDLYYRMKDRYEGDIIWFDGVCAIAFNIEGELEVDAVHYDSN